MKGFEVKFNIYANSQEEADEVSQTIKDFIAENAKNQVAITANKVSKAIKNWKSNVFVKNHIINYFLNN